MLGEDACTGSRRTSKFTTFLINCNDGAAALRNLASPQTPMGVLAKSEARGAFISVALSILTVPEDTAVFRISICSIKSGAVGSRDGWLNFSSLSALHKVKLSTLL